MCSAGLADAKKARVKIISKPAGASVTLGAGGGKSLGRTPLRASLPVGDHVLVFNLDGFVESVETITVKRSGEAFSFSLDRAETGSIRVVSKKRGALKGARIFVDGEEVGRVPDTIKVQAGARQVEVKKDGWKTFEKWVEVGVGGEILVRADSMSEGSENRDPFGGKGDDDDDDDDGDDDDDDDDAGDDDDSGDDDDDDDDAGDDDGGKSSEERAKADDAEGKRVASTDPVDEEDSRISSSAPPAKPNRARGSLFSLTAGVDLSGRSFDYADRGNGLRSYSVFPYPIARLAAAVYPLGFTDSALLGGFGITGSIGIAPNRTSEAKIGEVVENVPTESGDYSVGARYRYPISSTTKIGLDAGINRRHFKFDTTEFPALEDISPNVEYESIYLGADLATAYSDRVGLTFHGEYLMLSSVGVLEQRFTVTSQLGLAAGAGVSYKISELLDVVLGLEYTLVSLGFEEMASAGELSASGSKDHYFGALLGVNLLL